jgi:hypothetical protein
MKIIIKDYFIRQGVDERLLCENVNNRYGEMIVELMNEATNPPHQSSRDFFKLVPDDYILYHT